MLVEDDPDMHSLLKDHLTNLNCELILPKNSLEAFQSISGKIFKEYPPQVIVTDLKMPDKTGLDLLELAQRQLPQTLVILITAHASVESAVKALKLGAFDYITKPFKLAELTHLIQKARELLQLKSENRKLQLELDKTQKRAQLLGKSPVMQELFQKMDRVAPATAPVLIQGESGTGKELVARALHEQSSFRQGPFVAINCSAIPNELLESEFFGFSRGAFTGATQSKKGLLASAQRGTLFLDEIGDLPLAMQAKLLRVLQDGKFRAVGETNETQANFRLISATHKDLVQMIEAETFREDLFYRISVLPLSVAPLRDRIEDFDLLIPHFLKISSQKNQISLKSIAPEAFRFLAQQPWPGNVRELQNTIERLVVLSEEDTITGPEVEAVFGSTKSPSIHLNNFTFPTSQQHFETLAELENRYVRWILQQTGYNKQLAAQILGVNRRTLQRWEKQSDPPQTTNTQEELT